jgi:excisionase family DNA binding protein
MVKQSEKLYSPPEAAERLGVTVAWIRKRILLRKVAVVKLGKLVRLPESELARLIEQGFRPALDRPAVQ